MDKMSRSGDDMSSSSSNCNIVWVRVDVLAVEVEDSWLLNLTGESASLVLCAVRSVKCRINLVGEQVTVKDEFFSLGS